MQSILSLPSLPGPLCLRVVAPDTVLSMGQIELNNILYSLDNGLALLYKYPSTRAGGARGIMVIVIGNGPGDTSSNPGRN